MGGLGMMTCSTFDTASLTDLSRFITIILIFGGAGYGDRLDGLCLSRAYQKRSAGCVEKGYPVCPRWGSDQDLFPRDAAGREELSGLWAGAGHQRV
jgi:hypothetical protein